MSGLLRVRVCHEVVDKSLVQVFELMEQNKKSLGIIDYSVSPTTLEQVFLQFAKQQQEHEQQ